MTTLVLSNFSDAIAELNQLTAPNKMAYCNINGYDFENLNLPYTSENFVRWLEIIREKLVEYDTILTVGCDVIFTNFKIKIEDKIGSGSVQYKPVIGTAPMPSYSFAFQPDARVIIAREHTSWWPINNDVMIWPKGLPSKAILSIFIEERETWLKYPWLWQAHLWDLIQTDERVKRAVRIVEAREMNSTFQPFIVDGQGKTTRIPGPSSWQFGDWILHALDMPMKMRIDVIKAFLPFAGNALYSELPKEITGRK